LKLKTLLEPRLSLQHMHSLQINEVFLVAVRLQTPFEAGFLSAQKHAIEIQTAIKATPPKNRDKKIYSENTQTNEMSL